MSIKPINFENGYTWNKQTCNNAALNGDLEVLKYVRENGCPWNEYTHSNVILNNRLEVLKYLQEMDVHRTI